MHLNFLNIALKTGTVIMLQMYYMSITSTPFNSVFAISGDRMINTGSSNTELNGMLFSTLDRDNDRYSGHCATKYSGGWWFNNCHDAYLNGPWATENWHDPWYPIIADGTNIVEVRLMIRPT